MAPAPGGTKGSGSGGTRGSGSGGSGSGSGGSRGSGSGGSGSGSGGTKGSGSGGSRGSGSGSGSSGSHGGGGDGGAGKSTLTFVMGTPGEVEVTVSETSEGHLHFKFDQADFASDYVDIDGIFFDVNPGIDFGSINYWPEPNQDDYTNVTHIEAEEDGVTGLPGGPDVGGSFDVGFQFGTADDGTASGEVMSGNFTLWSAGGLSLEDIDLAGMKVMVNSSSGDGQVLGVSDSDLSLTDVMSLMSLPPGEDEEGTDDDPDALSEIPFV